MVNTGPRRVGCTLSLTARGPATLWLQVAVAAPDQELLLISTDGSVVPVEEIRVAEARVHVADLVAGSTTVTYTATIPGSADAPRTVSAGERMVALRPSRYCPSDTMGGFANQTFNRDQPRAALVDDVVAWVGRHLTYQPVSGPTDNAVDTLLAGAGVCRDYAHLVVTLLRSLDVAARLVAVYAPGLSPMDFHAVVEVDIDGVWRLVDATRLAPRPSLVRIGHGRDAADTAFMTGFGPVTLDGQSVTATVEGDLPVDDGHALVGIA